VLDETLAAAATAGMQTARLTGVEPETQLGYAALHRFLLPFADHLEQLPIPQREPTGPLPALAGLPELVLGGLDDGAAQELLASLALVEVARVLSPGQLAGSEVLPEPLPVGGSLEKAFGRRVNRLPPEARLLLAVAAAEPAAPQELL